MKMARAIPTEEELRKQREPFCVFHKDAFLRIYDDLHPTKDITIEQSLVTQTGSYLLEHPWRAIGNTRVFDHKLWVNMFSASGDVDEATAAFITYFNDRLRSYEIMASLKEVELDELGNLTMAVFAA